MTIEEVKQMKSQFEMGIAKAIEVFEEQTGCAVTELIITKTDMHPLREWIEVTAKIQL